MADDLGPEIGSLVLRLDHGDIIKGAVGLDSDQGDDGPAITLSGDLVNHRHRRDISLIIGEINGGNFGSPVRVFVGSDKLVFRIIKMFVQCLHYSFPLPLFNDRRGETVNDREQTAGNDAQNQQKRCISYGLIHSCLLNKPDNPGRFSQL